MYSQLPARMRFRFSFLYYKPFNLLPWRLEAVQLTLEQQGLSCEVQLYPDFFSIIIQLALHIHSFHIQEFN